VEALGDLDINIAHDARYFIERRRFEYAMRPREQQ
jgi:hypothetical protein